MLSDRMLYLQGLLMSLMMGVLAIAEVESSILTAAGVPLPRDAEAQGYYAITGVNTGRNTQTGARPARRNILDLQNDTPSWSLYILALAAMQNADDSDPLSYFQVAGIHGRPYVPWNHFNQVSGAGPGTSAFGGYCPHNSVLFPTWHRPYLVLVEQIIAAHAQSIAKTYTGPASSVYQTAAANLRLPYWDWASVPDIPDVVSQQTVQITTPSGVQWVYNPLYTYAFHQFPLNTTLFPGGGLANSPSTYRSDTANQDLENNNLMERTWSALVKSTSYNAFATSATSGTSIENVHNDVHGSVGGGGHMTYLDWSAFDPIFWLHHANLDRMFALWQAAYPNSYLTPLADPGTFTIIPQSMDSATTSLTPFTSNSAGQAYNSNSARSLNLFDYSYPEIEDWHQTTEQLRQNVTAQIYNLYDPNGVFDRDQSAARRSLRTRKTLTPGCETREWTINLAINKFDLDGCAFWLRFFVGDIPPNPHDWLTNVDVTSIQIVPPPQTGQGPFREIIEYDEINLDKYIAKAGYDSEDVQAVVGFLHENLQWRVQKLDGTVVPTEQIPSLRIAVSDEVVRFPVDNTAFPIYGEKNLHPDVTETKPDGLTSR